MPFTLSHPAAVLPLHRALGRFGVFSALVIGSMAPDFIYYLPVDVRRSTTHTAAALFWFCLPAGLAAHLIFDQLLKVPCTFLLPHPLRRRLGAVASTPLTAAHLGAVALCVVLGAATHIVWDSFTHGSGWGVGSPLRTPLAHVFGIPIHGARLLQHASSIAGAAVLAVWVARWYRATPAQALPPAPFAESARAPIAAALCALPALVALSQGAALAAAAPAGGAFAFAAAVATFRLSVAAALLGLAAYGLLWRRRMDSRRPGP